MYFSIFESSFVMLQLNKTSLWIGKASEEAHLKRCTESKAGRLDIRKFPKLKIPDQVSKKWVLKFTVGLYIFVNFMHSSSHSSCRDRLVT